MKSIIKISFALLSLISWSMSFASHHFHGHSGRHQQANNACINYARNIAIDYKGNRNWGQFNLNRLCDKSAYSSQPARCFAKVMHGGVNWGGGTQWKWINAINLCQNTPNAQRTIRCFRTNVANGMHWTKATDYCHWRKLSHRTATEDNARYRHHRNRINSHRYKLRTCARSIQGQIAWNYQGNRDWNSVNIARLCRGAEYSAEPGHCFRKVMFGGVNWGGGTQWKWENAVKLCSGTNNSNRTVYCFKNQIRTGNVWGRAIELCRQR